MAALTAMFCLFQVTREIVESLEKQDHQEGREKLEVLDTPALLGLQACRGRLAVPVQRELPAIRENPVLPAVADLLAKLEAQDETDSPE